MDEITPARKLDDEYWGIVSEIHGSVQMPMCEMAMDSVSEEIEVFKGMNYPVECCGGTTNCGCAHQNNLEAPEQCDACT